MISPHGLFSDRFLLENEGDRDPDPSFASAFAPLSRRTVCYSIVSDYQMSRKNNIACIKDLLKVVLRAI